MTDDATEATPIDHTLDVGTGETTISYKPRCPSCRETLRRVVLHPGEEAHNSCPRCNDKIMVRNSDSELSETLEADE